MKNFHKYKKLLSILGSMLAIVVVFKFTSTDMPKAEVELKLEGDQFVSQTIKVHVDGAVINQGVYELAEGSRVEDAIKEAGGLSDDANTEFLNYAQVLVDGEKITVLKQYNTSGTEVEETIAIYNRDDYSALEKLNYMTAEDYQAIPGIGEKISQEIIATRANLGMFSQIEELKQVSGIGDSKYEKIITFIQ
jgi:competence protein ComEA